MAHIEFDKFVEIENYGRLEAYCIVQLPLLLSYFSMFWLFNGFSVLENVILAREIILSKIRKIITG